MPEKLNIDLVRQRIENVSKDEYTLLSDTYINNREKLKFRHNKCGKAFYMNFNKFYNNHRRCPECSPTKRKTHNEFIKSVEIVHGNDYEVLDEYKNNRTPLRIRHNICGEIFIMSPHDFIGSKYNCPFCCPTRKKNMQSFLEEASKMDDFKDYEFLEDYRNAHAPILVRHLLCNKIYKVRPRNFLDRGPGTKNRCPYCLKKGMPKESKPMVFIKQVLEDNKISYRQEVTFSDCRSKVGKMLPFDFYLEIKGKIIIIEYDGSQHYHKTFTLGNNTYAKIHENDLIKNTYCKQKKYFLLRLNYKQKLSEIKESIENLIRTFNDYPNVE